MDLQASSWLGSAVLLFEGPVGVNLPGTDDFDHWIKDGKAYAAVYMKLRYEPRAEYGLTRSRRTAFKAGARGIKQISKSQRAGCAAGPHEKRIRAPEAKLALRYSAHQFLHLFLVGTARCGALGLRCRLLPCRTLHLFALNLVFDFLGVCHS